MAFIRSSLLLGLRSAFKGRDWRGEGELRKECNHLSKVASWRNRAASCHVSRARTFVINELISVCQLAPLFPCPTVLDTSYSINMTYALLCILCLLVQAARCRTAAQLCRGTAERADDGNWYCAEVTAITYKNISQAGEYNRTTRVNPKTGLCDHEPVVYSGVGPFTPLIGEVFQITSIFL